MKCKDFYSDTRDLNSGNGPYTVAMVAASATDAHDTPPDTKFLPQT